MQYSVWAEFAILQLLYVKTYWQIVVLDNFFNCFSRSGWSGGQGDQNGQGGQSCRNIRWSGWLGWSEWSGWLPLPPYICQQETSPKWTDLKERESTFAKNSLLKQHWVIHELHNFQPSKHLLVFCRQDKEISWQGSGENFLHLETSIFYLKKNYSQFVLESKDLLWGACWWHIDHFQ